MKNNNFFFNREGGDIHKIEQELANCDPQAKFCPPPDFTNKIFVVHSHTHLFTYCLWHLWSYDIRVEELWQRQYGPQNPTHLLFVHLGKGFANPWNRHPNTSENFYSLFLLLDFYPQVKHQVGPCATRNPSLPNGTLRNGRGPRPKCHSFPNQVGRGLKGF